MNFLNYFGNEECFDLVLDLLEYEKDDSLSLQTLVNLAILISLPAFVYHKNFISEYGARIINAIKLRLLGAPSKNIKEIRKDQYETL